MSAFGKHGRRCDWCGKFTTRHDGLYTRPIKNAYGINLAGYIRQPSWMFNDDGSLIAGNENDDSDICEECWGDLCPHCGSDKVVMITPATPGPIGWGGRCKACGKTWDMPMPSGEEYPAPRTPVPGSDTALAQGCTCPVMDNAHGRGWRQTSDGTPIFVMVEGCPVHSPSSPPAGTHGGTHGGTQREEA